MASGAILALGGLWLGTGKERCQCTLALWVYNQICHCAIPRLFLSVVPSLYHSCYSADKSSPVCAGSTGWYLLVWLLMLVLVLQMRTGCLVQPLPLQVFATFDAGRSQEFIPSGSTATAGCSSWGDGVGHCTECLSAVSQWGHACQLCCSRPREPDVGKPVSAG